MFSVAKYLRKSLLTICLSGLVCPAFAAPTMEQPDRNIAVYNLVSERVGLQGFDPVSYFAEGGGVPKLGLANISVEYGGVVYYFADIENRSMFLTDSTKFEPTFGGWCAWAMANDSFADIDPSLYTFTKTVNGKLQPADSQDLSSRRIHFFISRGAKARFDLDLNKYENLADGFWSSESKSGEQPRL
jgi:hypothetical protein